MSTQPKSKKMKQQTIISLVSRGAKRFVSTKLDIPVDDKLSSPSRNSESSWTPSRIRKSSVSSVSSGASECSDEESMSDLEPKESLLSKQLQSEIKSYVAKEFCNMMEENEFVSDTRFQMLIDNCILQSKELEEAFAARIAEIKNLQNELDKQHNKIAKMEKELTELKNKDAKLSASGASLAPTEVEQLKGVIRRTKREENSYWNRSIRISNLDQIPKDGNRFSNIQNILRKKGLAFLINQCESYFLYNDKSSSSSLRITFRSYAERNHYMIKARKVLRDLENKSIFLDNMVCPEFVPRKKELIQIGQTMKSKGEIVKFSVEMKQGSPHLKVITKENKAAWVDPDL